jgi:putative tricarboxylic transport membrane protein
MAKEGKAMTALAITATASALGGLIGDIVAVLASTFMLSFILLFGTPEYFLFGILGLALVSLVSQGSFYKGLISALFGLTITTVGIARGMADIRFTFGCFALYDGISFLPIVLGFFGVATMSQLASQSEKQISKIDILGGSRLEGVIITLKNWKTLVKSSMLGFFIGTIPGTGAAVANFVAYGEAVRSAKDKSRFGKGNPTGLVATESANNACIDGALIPTLVFGIPGSATTAVLLAAMLLQGLRPGSQLFQGDGLIVTLSLFVGLFASEIMITIFGLGTVKILARITTVNKHLIIPFVIIVATLGIFSLKFSWADVIIMGAAGILGYVMQKYGFPIIPAVIAVVLGKIIEENLIRTIALGDGSLILLIKKPVSLFLLTITAIVIITPLVKPFFKKANTRKNRNPRIAGSTR